MKKRTFSTVSGVWDDVYQPFSAFCLQNGKKISVETVVAMMRYLKTENQELYNEIVRELKDQDNPKNFEILTRI